MGSDSDGSGGSEGSLWEPNTPVRPSSGSRRATPRTTTPTAPPAGPLTAPPGTPPGTPPGGPPPPRGRWYRRPLGVAALGLLLVVVAGLSGVYLASERLGDKVSRVENAFGGLDEVNRPPLTSALTFLLVATDSRTDTAGPGVTDPRYGTDVVMIARVAPDRQSATVVSIPRDTLVDIPRRGRDRIAAAYTTGGPSLLVQTVEQLAGVRMDHFAVVDFAGFRTVVDTVGGIDLDVPAGTDHMDGAEALAYVRGGGGAGSEERARRQQEAFRAVLGKAVSNDVLVDPIRLYDFLDASAVAIGVDDTLGNNTLRVLALQLIGLRPEKVDFVRVPEAGAGGARAGDAVQLDAARAPLLWAALREGRVDGYVRQNPQDVLVPAGG